MASAIEALKGEQRRVLGIPFSGNNVGGSGAEVVDIISKYPWIADESIAGSEETSTDGKTFNKKNNIPFCYVIERISAVNASIANIANMLNALGQQINKTIDNAQSAAEALGMSVEEGSTTHTVIQGVRKGVGTIGNILEEVKSKFKFDSLLRANNLESGIFSPYRYLYITKPSLKKFVFPLATGDSSFSVVKNNWGAAPKLPGFLEQTLGKGVEMLKTGAGLNNFIDNITSGLNGNAADIGNVDETPKSYKYPLDGDSVNVQFTLYNTTKLNAWKNNYRFLLLFVLRNLPMRIDAFGYSPPVLYDIIIPGSKRMPVCSAETIRIVPKGMVRTLTCDNFIKGSGTLLVNVPEAWEVNITFKSLIGPSANMVLSEMIGNLNITVTTEEVSTGDASQQTTDNSSVTTESSGSSGSGSLFPDGGGPEMPDDPLPIT